MAEKGSGIKELLQAEEKASKIVAEARLKKEEKLKKAKIDAEQEVIQFRSQKEAEFSKYKDSHMGDSDISKKLEEETNVQLKAVKEAATKHTKEVVGILMDSVTKVDTEVPLRQREREA